MFTMAIGLWVVSLCWLVFNVNPGLRMAAQGRLLKGYGQFFFLSSSTISTAFVESAINQVLSKRFVKKQQMHWTDPRRSPFTASTDPRFERGLALHAVALVPRNGRNMRCEGGVAPVFPGLLLPLHVDGARRCWVFSGGRMSGYWVMLCLCGFLLIVLGSQPFRIML